MAEVSYKDNDRALHAPSVAGDPLHAEGAIPVNSLVAPAGLLGDVTMGQSRQDIPVGTVQHLPPHHQPGNLYTFESTGEAELLGQDSKEGLRDDNYPNTVPNVKLAGADGTTAAGPQGQPVDWSSVAPYEYPEFPGTPERKSPANINDPAPLT